jgi:hypothetical protein
MVTPGGPLALAILSIAHPKFLLITVACFYCNKGVLDCAPVLPVLNFGGLDTPRSDEEESLVREVVNVIEKVAESASN